jgi:hypothetical protein
MRFGWKILGLRPYLVTASGQTLLHDFSAGFCTEKRRVLVSAVCV